MYFKQNYAKNKLINKNFQLPYIYINSVIENTETMTLICQINAPGNVIFSKKTLKFCPFCLTAKNSVSVYSSLDVQICNL